MAFEHLRGLRIHGHRGHKEVHISIIKFAKWVRRTWNFPRRLNVYLLPWKFLIARDGGRCFGTIWIPDDPELYPYIRLATGDYEARKKKYGRDNALASDLCTLCHEIIHYWQWLDTNDMWERGVDSQASYMVKLYSETTDHP